MHVEEVNVTDTEPCGSSEGFEVNEEVLIHDLYLQVNPFLGQTFLGISGPLLYRPADCTGTGMALAPRWLADVQAAPLAPGDVADPGSGHPE